MDEKFNDCTLWAQTMSMCKIIFFREMKNYQVKFNIIHLSLIFSRLFISSKKNAFQGWMILLHVEREVSRSLWKEVLSSEQLPKDFYPWVCVDTCGIWFDTCGIWGPWDCWLCWGCCWDTWGCCWETCGCCWVTWGSCCETWGSWFETLNMIVKEVIDPGMFINITSQSINWLRSQFVKYK